MPITLETDTEKNAESCTTFWNPYYEMKKKKNKNKNETKQKCMMPIDDLDIEKR